VIVEPNRLGDHICYYSDLRKVKAHYPNWKMSFSLSSIVKDVIDGWRQRLSSQPSQSESLSARGS
jgi:CDP-paratose 2-epimerase